MKIIRPNVTEDTIREYERSLNIKFKDAHRTDFEKYDKTVNLGGITCSIAILFLIALIILGVVSIVGAVIGTLPTYAAPLLFAFGVFCIIPCGVGAYFENKEENLLLELEKERSAWGFEPICVCSMQDYRHLRNDRNNRPITFPAFDRLRHSLNEIIKFEAPEVTEIEFCEYDNEWEAIYLFAHSEGQPVYTVGPIACDNEAFKTIYHDGSVSADFSYLDREFEFAKAKIEEMIARAQGDAPYYEDKSSPHYKSPSSLSQNMILYNKRPSNIKNPVIFGQSKAGRMHRVFSEKDFDLTRVPSYVKTINRFEDCDGNVFYEYLDDYGREKD